jgi:hypothetical protein
MFCTCELASLLKEILNLHEDREVAKADRREEPLSLAVANQK